MRPLCVWHAGCLDGLTGAWIVREYLGGEVDFHEGRYGDPLPEVDDRDVILVDFSYKAPQLVELAARARTVLLVDHHESAFREIEKLDTRVYLPVATGQDYRHLILSPGSYRYMDLERSGAGLAWDFFNPYEPRPRFVNHIEDRDLWRFWIPGTRAFTAGLKSYPLTFETIDRFSPGVGSADLIVRGIPIVEFNDERVAEIVKTAVERDFAGHKILVANCPFAFASDVGNELCKGRPFSATYFDIGDQRHWSLRSDKDGLDVAKIAANRGGGGHVHAAGFKRSVGLPLDAFDIFQTESDPR